MKNRLKRWMSMFLVAVLVVSGLTTDVYAAAGGRAAQPEFPAEPYVRKLSATRLEDLSGQDAVYFGTATADLEEGEAYYSIPVYREGNLETEASVSLLTLDISALYGQDYELCEEEVYVSGDEQTLQQKGVETNMMVSNETALEGMTATEEEAEAASEETDPTEETEGEASCTESEADSGDGTKALGSVSSIITDACLGEGWDADETLATSLSSENLDFSAGYVLHFASGENEKTVVFHVMEDELEEGQELFEFVLADAEGTAAAGQITFAAVINDNEELHDSEISFSAESYASNQGQVTVIVNRTGSEYALIDFYLRSSGDTAQAGTNYVEFDELLSMQPWQTSVEYTFPVTGEGRMEVVMVPETGCVLAGSGCAEVLIREAEATDPEETGTFTRQTAELLTEEERILLGLSEEENGFNISIGGKTYTVKYTGTGSGVKKGGIYDTTTYKDPVKVGDYYFTTTENCEYGNDGNTGSVNYESEYQENEDPGEAFGHLYWYSPICWQMGSSYLKTNCQVPGTYYRCVIPDWEGLYYACYYQTHEFQVKAGDVTVDEKKIKADTAASHVGCFERLVDDRVQIDLPYGVTNKNLAFEVHTADRWPAATPKNGLNVYGFACMYRSYEVKIGTYGGLDYRTAAGSTVNSLPYRMLCQSGIKSSDSSDLYHTVYTDSDEEESQIVFSPAAVYLNGHSGVFGQVTGYTITYNCEAGKASDRREVRYPEDFFRYMDAKKETASADDVIPYTDTDPENYVSSRKEAALSSLTTISFDRYLVDWLDSIGKEIYGEDAAIKSESVKLSFRPEISYSDIKVHVLAPTDGTGKAKFKDSALTETERIPDENQPDQKTAIASPHIYHAGDTLDLSAQSLDSSKVVVGYQVAHDKKGIKFDTVTSTTQLFLQAYEDSNDVWIRPVLSSVQNRIEIRYEGDAEQHLTVSGLIDPKKLKGTAYEGQHIYQATTGKSSILEQMNPVVGQVYDLVLTVKDQPAEKGYVYRPYIKDAFGHKANTQVFPVIARGDPADNVITIGVEKVKESELREITLSGALVLDQESTLRASGQAVTSTPAQGYSVTAFSRQQKDKNGTVYPELKQAVTGEDGTWKLAGILAKTGDIIPVRISSGTDDGDMELIRVGSDDVAEAGKLEVAYPYAAPRVISIMYSYESMMNNLARDLNQNTVNIYDDTLDLQLTVDEKDIKVEEVFLRVVPYMGDSYDIPTERKQDTEQIRADVWNAQIKMNKTLLSGDRLFVYVTGTIKQNGIKKKVTYPVRDTGISFYKEYEPRTNQWLSSELGEDDHKIDLPFVGTGNQTPSVTSGLISWEKNTWQGGQGYTLSINISGSAGKQKWKNLDNKLSAFKSFSLQAKMQHMKANSFMDKYTDVEYLPDSFDRFLDDDQKSYRNLAQQLEKNQRIRKEQALQGCAVPKEKLTQNDWEFGLNILACLYYVKSGNSYVYDFCSMVVAGTFKTDFTRPFIVGFVPLYINFGFTGQAGYSGAWATPEGQKGISSDEFQAKKGNLLETVISSEEKEAGEFLLGATGFIGFGAGISKVLGGEINFAVSFQWGIKYPNPQDEKNGVMLAFSGGVKINLWFTSLEWSAFQAKKTWGSWEKEKDKDFEWYGCVESATKGKDSASLLAAGEERERELLYTEGDEQVYLVEKLAGTSDMTGFGSELSDGEELYGAGNEENLYAVPAELLKNAADDTYIQLVQTAEDGSLFMTYIGNRGAQDGEEGNSGKPNAEALYYTCYLASSGQWTTPQLLDGDGTFDTEPSLNLEKDLLTVTWSSAEEVIEDQSYLDRLSLLRIKTAVFRVNGDGSVTLETEPVYLSGNLASPSIAKKKESNTYSDLKGESWYQDGKIFGTFLRFDTGDLNSIEEVTDFTKVRPRAYLAEYDTESGVLVHLKDLSLTDSSSVLMDIDTELIPVKGSQGSGDKTFLAVTYIQDTDGELSTEEDDDLKLCLVELERDDQSTFVYPSLNITEENGDCVYRQKTTEVYEGDSYAKISVADDPDQDGVKGLSQLNVRLVETAGSYYLTFLKDGYLFDVIDLGVYLEEMFTEDALAGMYRSRAAQSGGFSVSEAAAAGSRLAGGEEKEAWFAIDTADLNAAWEAAGKIPGQWKKSAAEADEGTLTPEWGNGQKRTIFEGSLLEGISKGRFSTLETSFGGAAGEKTCIGSYQVVSDGDDLYVIYTDYPDNEITAEKELFCVKLNLYDKDKQPEDTEEEIYFSAPVQLTDASRVIRTFAASMNNGVITVVSDMYDQVIPDGGGLINGENSIVRTKYRPKSELVLQESLTDYGFDFGATEEEGDYIWVKYQFGNAGVEPQKGYRTWVEQNGTVIFEEKALSEEGKVLHSGETHACSFVWKPESSIEGAVLKIYVADEDGTVRDEEELKIEGVRRLTVMQTDTEKTDTGYQTAAVIKNTGSTATEAGTILLNLLNDDYTVKKTCASAQIEALEPGESRELTFTINPEWSDFTANGTLRMELRLAGNDTLGYTTDYIAGSPDMAVIEKNADSVTVRPGQSRRLNVTAEPLSEATGDVIYSISDPAIADIAEDGTVTGRKKGTAVVTAYLTRWGVSDDITIVVDPQSSDDNTDSETVQSLPSYVDQGGSWKRDSAGNWSYKTRVGVQAKDRWMAVARSTFGGGSGFEWFRFDKDGNMVTGWFKDSDDRMYYLQMISDGNRGRMLTGWQKIDGKWYYFSTVSNGYKGELLKNTTTPDGYKVGADGAWTEN